MASSSKEANKKNNPLLHLVSGGCAGLVESSICHPLDTIKTRMQLRQKSSSIEAIKHRASSMAEPQLNRLRSSFVEPLQQLSHSLREPRFQANGSAVTLERNSATVSSAKPIRIVNSNNGRAVVKPLGPFGTATRIIQREGFLALYKGLTAVYCGIVPKMAIRFVSFEQYKEIGGRLTSQAPTATSVVFSAGLMSGLTEAVLVVTPAEVCKIRMQAQHHSLVDATTAKPKYRNVVQTAATIVREEGFGALYKGIVPTMLRQSCNQAVNFTMYQTMKSKWLARQGRDKLESYESLLLGGLSGGMGPLVNNPLDVVKTRLQKQTSGKYSGLMQSMQLIAKEEGFLALWKGITPRLMRIMPGQAITFMTYEFVSGKLLQSGMM